MKLARTALPGVLIVEPQAFEDDRGWFMETFNELRWEAALRELGEPLPRRFVQDNHSCSHAGVLRGLHFQAAPRAQGKLVRVVNGAAFDVAVDLRPGSPHRGRWFGITLSAANRRQLWIPEGFAHGFLALEDDTHFLYKTTDVYDKASERAIRWDDADLGIEWPALPGGQAPRVSDKDRAAPDLRTLGAC
jgi:dTDP-4-dehydrorhamnose 3,5-epimerase